MFFIVLVYVLIRLFVFCMFTDNVFVPVFVGINLVFVTSAFVGQLILRSRLQLSKDQSRPELSAQSCRITL